jgi:hypothetical protein
VPIDHRDADDRGIITRIDGAREGPVNSAINLSVIVRPSVARALAEIDADILRAERRCRVNRSAANGPTPL